LALEWEFSPKVMLMLKWRHLAANFSNFAPLFRNVGRRHLQQASPSQSSHDGLAATTTATTSAGAAPPVKGKQSRLIEG